MYKHTILLDEYSSDKTPIEMHALGLIQYDLPLHVVHLNSKC
jgi:hypothetical protein